MTEVAILTCLTEADVARAYNAGQRFRDLGGQPARVMPGLDAQGHHIVTVYCQTQRGPTGSYRMHEIACNFGVPVHCDFVLP